MVSDRKDKEKDRSEDGIEDIPTFSVTTPTGEKVQFYKLSALIPRNGKLRGRKRRTRRRERGLTSDRGKVICEDASGTGPKGNHDATRASLLLPLETPHSVLHGFCSGCGSYFGVTRMQLARFLQCDESELPADLCGLFLEVGSCNQCDSDVVSVQLKRIDQAKMS